MRLSQEACDRLVLFQSLMQDDVQIFLSDAAPFDEQQLVCILFILLIE